jgi:hypothetical protein
VADPWIRIKNTHIRLRQRVPWQVCCDCVGAAGIQLKNRDELRDHIPSIVDDVGVIAVAAVHRVGAGAAVEDVVHGPAIERVRPVLSFEEVAVISALDDVAECVAGAVEEAVAGIREIFDVAMSGTSCRQLITIVGAHLVGAAHVAQYRRRTLHPDGSDLGYEIVGVNDIDVVVGSAIHRVGAGAAVEGVAASTAKQDIVADAAMQLVLSVVSDDLVVEQRPDNGVGLLTAVDQVEVIVGEFVDRECVGIANAVPVLRVGEAVDRNGMEVFDAVVVVDPALRDEVVPVIHCLDLAGMVPSALSPDTTVKVCPPTWPHGSVTCRRTMSPGCSSDYQLSPIPPSEPR